MVQNLAFSLTDVSYSYGGIRALCRVSAECREGEWLAVVGRNGSGKSTLIKFLNALLTPTQGSCRVFGLDTSDMRNTLEIRKHVAMVFQNPESQIVGVTVEDDAAFALENLCLPSDEIERRVALSLEETGLLHMRRNLTHTLSGGEKQRLALAGAMAQGAKMFLLDEATSMLDPEGREAMHALFARLHRAGHTIVQVTHDPEEIRLADRVITLDGGHVTSPPPCPPLPINGEGGEKVSYSPSPFMGRGSGGEVLQGEVSHLTVSALRHTYNDGATKKEVLSGISFDFYRGEFISLLGRTGSGKSTLIQYLNALFMTEKDCGEIFIGGENVKKNPRAARRRVGMVFQQPEQQLFEQTVREELCFALKNWDIPKEQHEDLIIEAIRHVGLPLSMLERCPLQLSGGEMRRVAIASILVAKPEWLVLDEPTAGLDIEGRAELSALLSGLKSQGTGIFVVTHDRSFAAAHSDRIFELRDGRFP